MSARQEKKLEWPDRPIGTTASHSSFAATTFATVALSSDA
jgi:hypothetical protein